MNRLSTRVCLFCLCLGWAAGCSKNAALPPETDPNAAREAMTAALDAWKEGKTPDSLKQKQPPVDFRDTNWEKGSILKDYTIKADERFGVSIKLTVQLQLQDKDGNIRERIAVYNVDTGPTMVIRPNF